MLNAFPNDVFGLERMLSGFGMPDPSSLLAGTARQGRGRSLIPVLKTHYAPSVLRGGETPVV
jgi:hypothetical protein